MRRIEPSRSYSPKSVTRTSIEEWRRLHAEDSEAYRRDLIDRPQRFDSHSWQRAIRTWSNEIVQVGDGVLSGVPVVVKDLFDVRGEVTGCSSRVMIEKLAAERGPARTDAALVQFFRELGATISGRSQMNEFAYGIDGRNQYSGDCPHPLDSTRIPGGSSSGSAWAVASGVSPIGLGTDTGGSIRLPAALCGIYGFRTSPEEDWTRGAFPLAPSFDTVGWFTADATDMNLLISTFFAPTDKRDASSSPGRVATILPPGVELDSEMRLLWAHIGANLERVGVDSVDEEKSDDLLGDRLLDAYNVIGSSEAYEAHSHWLDRFRGDYTDAVWKLIDRGRRWSADRRAAAEETLTEVRAYFDAVLENYDCIVLPATPLVTPKTAAADAEFRAQVLRLNAPGSLAGLPAIALPVRFDAVRSGGIQVLCRRGEEYRFLPIVAAWENALAAR